MTTTTGQQRITRATELDLTLDLVETRSNGQRPAYSNTDMKRLLLVSKSRAPWYRRALRWVREWVATH